MESTITVPKTLREAIVYYSTLKVCHDLIVSIRFPSGIACVHCGDMTNVKFMESVQRFKCYGCRKQFSIKSGTVLEDSPISLTKWLPCFWLLTNAKNGISSCEVSRALGVTQKTAWFMLHRIRHVLATGTFEKMKGTVEADETYIGGLERIDLDFKINKEPTAINSKRDLKSFIEKLKVIESFIPDDLTASLPDKIGETAVISNPKIGERIIDRALVVLSDFPKGLRAAQVSELLGTYYPGVAPVAVTTVASVMRRKPYMKLITVDNGLFRATEAGIRHAYEVKALQEKSSEPSDNGHVPEPINQT